MTDKDLAAVRVLSDGELYDDAEKLVRDFSQRPPRAAQINGLAQFSRSWAEWTSFVAHQKGRPLHPDRDFYVALSSWNQKLPQRAKDWGLIPDGLTKSELQARRDQVCSLLVAEFAQHLAAEISFWQRPKGH